MAEDTKQSLGQVLRTYRGRKSQKAVAKLAQISQTYYSDLENDKVSSPSREVIANLARALGISYDYLATVAWGTDPLTLNQLPQLAHLPVQVAEELAQIWPSLTLRDQESILEHARALSERRIRLRE